MLTEAAGSGVMPNMAHILGRWGARPMQASIPEISAVSWSGFMTGTHSGRHGIYGFVDLVKCGYQYRFPDFRDLRCPAFFDRLGALKMRSVVINLPSTYPAREIPGILVSGFVAPELNHAVAPVRYLPVLKQMGYRVDIDAEKGRRQPMEFMSELNYSLEVRREAAEYFWSQDDWHLFSLTITGTDRLFHFMFDAFKDTRHPFHDEFHRYLNKVDRVIGDLFAKIDGRDEFEFMMLSDHGFVGLREEVYLNPILKNHGFLSHEGRQLSSPENIGGNTLAFVLDPARIYIHTRERYARGRVERTDALRIRQDLKRLFQEYRIDGQPVIEKVLSGEEVYGDAAMGEAPDLVLLSRPGFDLKAGMKKEVEHGTTHFTGMHRWDNAFLLCSRPDLLGEPISIFNVYDLVFKLLSVPVPTAC